MEYRRALLWECEQTLSRLARDPQYFSKPDKALFQDIRRYFPITAQAQVAWIVQEGINAAVSFVEEQIEAGAFDGGVPRCRATTRKGKPCQRTPLPERDFCPSHQHLDGRPPDLSRACRPPRRNLVADRLETAARNLVAARDCPRTSSRAKGSGQPVTAGQSRGLSHT